MTPVSKRSRTRRWASSEYRFVAWFWGPVYWGVEVCWNRKRHWFIGRTEPDFKRRGW